MSTMGRAADKKALHDRDELKEAWRYADRMYARVRHLEKERETLIAHVFSLASVIGEGHASSIIRDMALRFIGQLKRQQSGKLDGGHNGSSSYHVGD